MAVEYQDRGIVCTDQGLRINGYYLIRGAKDVPYASIRGLERVTLSAARGRMRLWGTANPRYWLNLDRRRPSKSVGLIIDLGRFVHPFITPDDADAVERIVREHARLGPATGPPMPSPFV